MFHSYAMNTFQSRGECVCLNVFFLQLSGELTAITPSTARVTPKETSAAVTLPQTTTATTDPVHEQSLTTTQPVTALSGSRSNSTTQKVTTTSATSRLTTTQEAKMSNQHNKTRQLGRNTASPTVQSSRTGEKWGPCALDLIIWWFEIELFVQLGLFFFFFFYWNNLEKGFKGGEKAAKHFHGKWGGSCVG